MSLPYRRNVGAALFNRTGQVWVGQRMDRAGTMPGRWQMPQGGIDADEDPRAAVLRELEEEVGTANVEILAEHPDWLTYDLPPELAVQAFGGKYRGQKQKWFALRFLGDDADFVLDRHSHPEFAAWRWVELDELADLAVDFKRDIYADVARTFHRFASGS